ncbi:MAG: glycosyltransferase [Rhodospirillales bacterium]|nr:glycosyltransferase [Rhodospirillales bacterium]
MPQAPEFARFPPVLGGSGRAVIRIVHVIASIAAATGGPARAVADMARAVAARGHDVAIWTTDRDMTAAERAAPLPADGVARHVFAQGWPATFATSWPLARALDAAIPQADIVHIHSLYLFHVWYAARVCRKAGVPYLLRPHGTLDPFLRTRGRLKKALVGFAFQDRVIREAAALHFTAEEEMRLAAPYTSGAKGVIVPNGLDMGEYDSLPAPGGFIARHPELAGTKPVLFLSRINFKKGLDVLIPAFAKALAAEPALRLVIAGPDDGYKATAAAFAREAGVADKIVWTGMLAGEEKKQAFVDCTAFALPSWSENFGIAIVEAMACEAPVVISDRVNIWREISNAGAGLVSPPEIDHVAAHILLLAGDPLRARRMGEAGRRLASDRYDWKNIAVDLERVYREHARP